MKRNYKKSLFGIAIAVFMLGTSSYAVSNTNLPKDTTEAYKRWQALSTEEKQNYIEPAPYSLNIDDSVRISVFEKFTRGVGGQNEQTAYNLYDDVKFKVKDQKNTNECWAFSTTTAIETNVAKTRNKTIELSPRHIDYATSRTFLDGTNEKGYKREIGFGNFYIALGYCVSGNGPVLEADMPFENNENKIELNKIDKKPALKVEDYVQFATIYKKYSEDGTTFQYTNGQTTEYTEEQVQGVRNLIKKHITQYGGVMANLYLGGNDLSDRLNVDKIKAGTVDTIAYCSKNNSKLFDHAVTIVGWDDTYSKENFNEKNKPQKDGAYIVLNTSPGENGILSAMYVSYEDVWVEYSNFGIISTSDIDYDTLYQYDDYGYNVALPLTSNTGEEVKSAYTANVFSRQMTEKEEFLNEVSIYIASTCNVDIYVNAESDDKTKLTKVAAAGILEPGYHTIKLATPLKLTGNHFVVATKQVGDKIRIATEANLLSNGGNSNFWDYAKSQEGQSFISEDGTTWIDLNTMVKDTNLCIKAFTTYQDKEKVEITGITLNKTKVEMQEGETLNLVATITPSNATNKNVTWTSSNEEVATISKTGIITAVKKGTTTITATTEEGKKTATCTITVKEKTNQADNIYYPDTETKDTTTATGIIPQTGAKTTAIIIITISILVTGIICIKIRKMKDIK